MDVTRKCDTVVRDILYSMAERGLASLFGCIMDSNNIIYDDYAMMACISVLLYYNNILLLL